MSAKRGTMRDMGRYFPVVRGLGHSWPEIAIATAGLFALTLIAWAIHPALLILIVCAAFAVFNVKLNWLQRRQERLEDFAVPPRLRRGGPK